MIADRLLREHGLHLDVPAPQDRRRAVEGAELLLDARRARHGRVHVRARRHPARPDADRSAQGDPRHDRRPRRRWRLRIDEESRPAPAERPSVRHDPLRQRHQGPTRAPASRLRDATLPHRARASSSSSPAPSGAGKSTILKLSYMEERPTRGEVRVSGVSSSRGRRARTSRSCDASSASSSRTSACSTTAPPRRTSRSRSR